MCAWAFFPPCAPCALQLTTKLRDEWTSAAFIQSDCCDSIHGIVGHLWAGGCEGARGYADLVVAAWGWRAGWEAGRGRPSRGTPSRRCPCPYTRAAAACARVPRGWGLICPCAANLSEAVADAVNAGLGASYGQPRCAGPPAQRESARALPFPGDTVAQAACSPGASRVMKRLCPVTTRCCACVSAWLPAQIVESAFIVFLLFSSSQ